MENQPEDSQAPATEMLRGFVDRIERLAEEKEGIMGDMKSVYTEAKNGGFDPKALREVIARRKKEREEVEEVDALVELYEKNLGT